MKIKGSLIWFTIPMITTSMVTTVTTAMGVIAVLTVLLATLLIFAGRKLHVAEDPRLDVVEEMLPHNNCGSCGYPSCRMFAEALVAQKALPGKCTVSSPEGRSAVATFLQVDEGTQVKRVARLACAGGRNVARVHAIYQGEPTCNAATQVGGGKSCAWGCLGYGDCARTCTFSAIHMNKQGLPVVDEEKCTACNDCVVTCPKSLFTLQKVTQHLWVACKNQEQGERVLEECLVGCTACGRCAADAPKLIQMQQHLPNIDNTAPHPVSTRKAIERCPTGAIVWVQNDGKIDKSSSADIPIRFTPLPPLFS